MFNQKDLEKIREETQRFFEKMNFDIGTEIEVEQTKENAVSLSLTTQEPQILIGKDGQTLMDIQHLLKRILGKILYKEDSDAEEHIFIDFDINNYKERKIEYLKELANGLANEVVLTKEEKILEPMSSYERRIIHLELSERTDVETKSIGEEPMRKIVIMPLVSQN
jgi:spoIIIJ-associated protein